MKSTVEMRAHLMMDVKERDSVTATDDKVNVIVRRSQGIRFVGS